MQLNLEDASGLFEKSKLEHLRRMFLRDGLIPDLRIISSVACLQSTGEKKDLISILKLAINSRKDLEILYEVLLQGYLFCGYPRAIESFFCLQQAIALSDNVDLSCISLRPFELPEVMMARGAETATLVHGNKFEKIQNKISALSPDLGYLMIAEGYGHILSRKGLDLKARELAVVSSISAMGSNRQLNSDIRGCRNAGCDDFEIYETIFTGLLWLPSERVIESLAVWSDITGLAVSEPVAEFIN